MSPKAASRFVGSLFAVLLFADTARSETETVQTDADTLVWSANPTFNFGVSQVAYVGRRPPKSVEVQRLRALLHFDLSALPATAVVNDATLRLFVNETITDPIDLDVTVSRLEEDFVEGNGSSGVTWNTQPAADPAFAQTATVDVLDGEWFEMDLTLLVLAARQSGEPDDLWLRVAATDETTNEDRYFSIRTKQYGAGADRAQVVIDYELPEVEEPGPEPDLSPSALDPTVPTLMGPATEFLYTGSNPIQTDVSPGTIEPSRAAVIRGQVRDAGGDPLSGVAIIILNEPDYGSTVTRSNGMFDIAVNGGGSLTVTYSKDGYLPVQRLVDVPTQDYAWVSDVAMIAPEDPVSVDPTQAGAFQVAQGVEVDEDDEDDIPMRQATLLFPEDVTATAALPNEGGTEQLTPPFDVRLTEFTLDGNGGPAAMPAELPPTSGYTYAVELSIDEALDLDATKVTFSEPVIFYVQNFLDFPIGTDVPQGYYDREQGRWLATNNGRVIKIVSIDSNDLAELDTDTTAGIDNGTAIGITTAEREELANLYSAGQELWRTTTQHFTPWDLNWGFEPETGAEFPGGEHASLEDPVDDSDKSCGSVIGCQNQSLGESIALTGTPFRLHYNSRRSRGYVAEHTITIPLGGASVPSVLRSIELFVDIAGRRFAQSFPSSAFDRR